MSGLVHYFLFSTGWWWRGMLPYMSAHISLVYDLWPCPFSSLVACDCTVAQSAAPLPLPLFLSLPLLLSPPLSVRCALLLIKSPELPLLEPRAARSALVTLEVWVCVHVRMCTICVLGHVRGVSGGFGRIQLPTALLQAMGITLTPANMSHNVPFALGNTLFIWVCMTMRLMWRLRTSILSDWVTFCHPTCKSYLLHALVSQNFSNISKLSSEAAFTLYYDSALVLKSGIRAILCILHH